MILENTGNFSVEKTFDCGQCFRFDPVGEGVFRGVVGKCAVTVRQMDGAVEIDGSDDEAFWRRYLALDADYDKIDRSICEALESERDRETVRRAVEYGAGIRILRQDPWETTVSFIISQNNNIPRIKKIIAALSKLAGEKIGDGEFAFPTARSLYELGEEGIAATRCGFRAKYIYDAARRALDGSFDPAAVAAFTDYADADEYMRRIAGVGPKVSACALLFGFGRLDAFPIDVWMKRLIATRFPDGLDHTRFGAYAGIAQQYLFYYERWHGAQAK